MGDREGGEDRGPGLDTTLQDSDIESNWDQVPAFPSPIPDLLLMAQRGYAATWLSCGVVVLLSGCYAVCGGTRTLCAIVACL